MWRRLGEAGNFALENSVAFDEARTRLEDVVGGNLDEASMAHGGNFVPTGAGGDIVRLHRLSTPGGENNVGPARKNLLRCDGPRGRFFFTAEFDKDVVAARALDQLGDPADAGDQRLGPFLKVNLGSGCAIGSDGLQGAMHPLDHLLGARALPDDLTEVADCSVNVLEIARVDRPHRDARADQIGGELVLDVGRGDDEIGFESQDRLEVSRSEAAYPRFLLRARRRPIECRDPHDLRPHAELMENIGPVRSQSDEALRNAGARHNRPE
jgi:hypothetical protein